MLLISTCTVTKNIYYINSGLIVIRLGWTNRDCVKLSGICEEHKNWVHIPRPSLNFKKGALSLINNFESAPQLPHRDISKHKSTSDKSSFSLQGQRANTVSTLILCHWALCLTFPKSLTSKRSKASNSSLFFMPNTSLHAVRKVLMFFRHRNYVGKTERVHLWASWKSAGSVTCTTDSMSH